VTDDLRIALGASQPGARRLAVELLGGLGDPDAFKDVAAALDDEDPGVRAAAVRALATLDPVAAADRAAAVATDPDPAVRAAAALALATCGNPGRARDVVATLVASGDPVERAAGIRAAGRLPTGEDSAPGPDLIEAAIEDPSPAVRAAAADALGTLGARDGLVLDGAGARLAAALDDDDVAVRQAAGRALGVRSEWSPLAVEVLRSGSDRAQSGALAALATGGGADAGVARESVRDWALAQVERATTLRRHAAALADGNRTKPERSVQEPADDPARAGDAGAFLRFLVDGRGRDVEDRILAAIATLGAPEANGPIRRSLRSTESETRAQAIEALEAIGDAGLGRALARLLDVDREMPEAPGDVLRDLEADPDPWIRLLAVRAGAERLSSEWQALAARASADPDPNVRAAIAAIRKPGGATMPETDRTLGEIDRMLFLRRVPLFSELAPEDLQRIATTATERLYPAGEALVREGEIGDELIVIVEGGVRVVRAEPNGERLLRRYEAGDHIGELAVLRDRPRVATVIAEADVRGLVIGGDGLRAILRERPDAAMAMLATLAERISVQ
jgi:HEAT repeat protein